ncbi:MAG: MCE family protein [Streptosporangiaceae bacterium]
MRPPSSLVLRIGAAIVAAALFAGAAGVFWPRNHDVHVTAYFPQTIGLYKGSDVRVLGIKIGKVTDIKPQGTSVRVDMAYDADRKVPSDAKAVIIAPAIVSDRYVQLAPAYTGGPVMRDGTTIPLARTATPVELDQIYGALNQLDVALGPKGANKNGSLSRLLRVSAANLKGQGDDVHTTVKNLSKATTTLAKGRKNLFGTVRNLETFTRALANSDDQVAAFNDNLSQVSRQLDGERQELAAALKNLAVALKRVERFVRENRGELSHNVKDLAKITKVLVKEKKALASFVTTAPVALSNLQHTYNPLTGTLDARADFQQTQNPTMYLCSLLYSLGEPPKQCESLLAPLKLLKVKNGGLPGGLDLSWLTELSRGLSQPRGGGQQGGGQRQSAQLSSGASATSSKAPMVAKGSGASGSSPRRSLPPGTDPDPTLGGILPGGGGP